MDLKALLMENIPFSLLVIMILSLYSIFLYRITGKSRSSDKLIWAFLVIFVLGFLYHMHLFCHVTKEGFFRVEDGLSRIIFSIQYTLEMFVANTVIFKSEVMNVLKHEPHLFQIFIPLYGAAILTSGFAIFHFLSRWLYNWLWLFIHILGAGKGDTHIFIGINSPSLYLAEDLLKSPERKRRIIFIDLPEMNETPQGISIWDFIAQFFKESRQKEDLSKYVVLRAGKGLSRLVPWLKNKDNNVYILSENQDKNMKILEELWARKSSMGLACRIYCHAKKEGLINRYDTITDSEDQIQFVDSSYLAVESLKKDPSGALLPVKYVDIARFLNGRKLGYVTSSFNCAILGFGETGIEALKFLYEFGAFPAVNKRKSPFKCHIFDSNIERAAGDIDLTSFRDPDAGEDEMVPHTCTIGNTAFWKEMKKIINDLNYIVICMGNDDLNMKMAIDLAEFATVNGRSSDSHFVIVVKQLKLTCINEATLQNANKTFNNFIKVFGQNKDIWKEKIITNTFMEAEARRFYESYSNMTICPPYSIQEWQARKDIIMGKKVSGVMPDYGDRCKAKRQLEQDYSNCLHISTKRELCSYIPSMGTGILPKNFYQIHCLSHMAQTFEYLAICEHLRWSASHIIMGYKHSRNTNEIMKLHKNIKPYAELDENTKHYDWLVVKNSL